MGGTFYGAGWYYDTGSQWLNKNDEIFNGLEDLINQKVNRFSINLDSSALLLEQLQGVGQLLQ